MAISVGYVVKESVNNLRRNILMTAAALLTVVISLALAGGALLLRASVNNATTQFRGGFDITIFMQPKTATQEQIDAIGRELKAMPELKEIQFVDRTMAFKEIRVLFRNSPEMLESFPDESFAPVQWRIKPKDPNQIEQIGKRFRDRAGVYDVTYARSIKTILTVTRWIQNVILLIAAALLVSAVVLILNTIRMAIFSRRREVAVMKLVGATNAFIRLPFMVEGMLQGLLGAVVAFGLVAIGSVTAQSAIRSSSVSLLKNFSVSGGEVLGTGVVMLLVGAIVGGIGSAIAVSRFLDV